MCVSGSKASSEPSVTCTLICGASEMPYLLDLGSRFDTQGYITNAPVTSLRWFLCVSVWWVLSSLPSLRRDGTGLLQCGYWMLPKRLSEWASSRERHPLQLHLTSGPVPFQQPSSPQSGNSAAFVWAKKLAQGFSTAGGRAKGRSLSSPKPCPAGLQEPSQKHRWR